MAAAICAIAAVIGCKEKRVEEPAEVIVGARIEDVLEHPDDFRGKTISFAGEVDDVYSSKVFTVGGSDFFDREILVALRGARPSAPPEEQELYSSSSTGAEGRRVRSL
jgi:hypothetical protein